MDLGGWLRSLGLGEYEAIFRENKIDETVIADLDAYTHPRLAAVPTEALPRDIAERRQITVMFSDLVGSTALSARMDPEDLREVISAYHAPLRTRVGIATSLVVVGDLIGSGAAQEQAIVGETPNVAARLQSTAEPNTVVIAESTRKLLGNLFDVEGLGAQDLKGISGPVRAWAVLRPASVESRFEALHARRLS
jgi:class 3 adenylate cyclase